MSHERIGGQYLVALGILMLLSGAFLALGALAIIERAIGPLGVAGLVLALAGLVVTIVGLRRHHRDDRNR